MPKVPYGYQRLNFRGYRSLWRGKRNEERPVPLGGQRPLLLRPKALVCADRFVGEQWAAALTVLHQSFNRIQEGIGGDVRGAQLAGCLQVIPGNLKGVFD